MTLTVIEKATILGMELDIYGDRENPLFLARDIAERINYAKSGNGSYDTNKMLNLVDDDDEKTSSVIKGRNTWFLTEHGVYSVLMKSNTEKAKEFRKGFKDFLKAWRKGQVKVIPNKPNEIPSNPYELLKDNTKAINEMFDVLGLNIPKEIIAHTSIVATQNMCGETFEPIKLLLNKQDEEQYHSASGILSKFNIKRQRTNETLMLLGLQSKGSTTMQKYVLTDLGKKYGVERAYTSNGHQGYEIKWKENLLDFISENIDSIPCEWIK